MKKLAYIIIASVLLGCGGGGGGGDSSVSPFPPTEAVTSIVAQTGAPKFTGFDLQFKQGDYWLYEWKDVYTSRGIVKDPFTGLYPWDTTTKTGTFRITLGQPRTILGVTFFQIATEYTGEAKNVTFPWLYVASFNNKVYGYRDDGVYLICDAQNGTWKGGSFFWGPSNEDQFGPAGTFSISLTGTGTYEVSYPSSGLNIGVGLSESEYYLPGVGPASQKVSTFSDTYHFFGDETLILIESSRGI